MIDFRYLKAFVLTAQHGSFSKAALELDIAQSAISRQIKLLEESLGVELIIRSSKQVVLTEKGKQLLAATQNFEKITDQIFISDEDRPIAIGILSGLIQNWFRPILAEYMKLYPKRKLEIKIADIIELRRGIENGKFDIVFGTENLQSDLVTSLKIFTEKLVLISKKEIQKKNLHEYRWLVFSNNDHLLKTAKVQSSNINYIEDMGVLIHLVKNDIGVAVVPDHLLQKEDQLKVYDIGLNEKSEIYMTTLNYKKWPKPIQDFVSLVKNKR